jgi:hypothetical protein
VNSPARESYIVTMFGSDVEIFASNCKAQIYP